MERILVIDDDPAVTSVLRRGLAYESFAVDTANSGEAGLELARERYPNLVILDVMMPRLDGLEVLRRLRAADGHLPVLMLTAKDTPADQVGLGAEAFHGPDRAWDPLGRRLQHRERRTRGGQVGLTNPRQSRQL